MLLLIILNVLAVIGESMSWVKEAQNIMELCVCFPAIDEVSL